MNKFIFNQIKKKIPKISPTEMIALTSGGTSLDRDILKGKVFLPKKVEPEYKLPVTMLSDLVSKFDNTTIYPNNNNNYWVDYLAKNKFFSFLIDEKYEGIKLSTNEISDVLIKY